MANTPLISLIVPFYNTEWMLFKKCLESIHSQEMPASGIEVILIDDCSTDKGMVKECEEYIADKDEFTLLRNAKNRGVSYSRNRGMDEAHGRFLMFADSDDWLVPGAFRSLEDVINRENPDTVFYDYIKEISGKEAVVSRGLDAKNYHALCEPMLVKLVISRGFNSPWISLYSRDIQGREKLYFKEGVSLGEDFLFNVSYLECYKKGAYLEKGLYVYRSNEDSATHVFTLKHAIDSGEGYYCRKRLLEKYFPDKDRYREIYETFYANYIVCIRRHILNGIQSEGLQAVDECLGIPWMEEALENPVEGLVPKAMKTVIKKKMYSVLFLLSQVKKLCGRKF